MRIDTNYNSTNLVGVNPTKSQDNQCFSEVLRKKEGNTDIYEKQQEDTFKPSCSEEVMQAYDKTLKDTGIDPFPMNRISTALIIHVEQGKEQLSSDFLGNTVESAKAREGFLIQYLHQRILSLWQRNVRFTRSFWII